MLPYIELVGDRYVLTLTEKDAKALGISSELYYEALSDVDKANATVRELQNDPTVVLELGTPQESIDDLSEEEEMPELQVMPSGTLTTNGNEETVAGYIGLLLEQKESDLHVGQMLP